MKKDFVRNLDNNANLFPYLTGKHYSGVYYMGIIFKNEINKERLYTSIKKTLEIYPFLKVKLKHDFFNYYFAKNNKEFILSEDDNPYYFINDYLFKIVCLNKKIILYMSHVLCDGISAKKILETIVNFYNYEKENNSYTVEDSYIKLYDKWKTIKKSKIAIKHKNFLKIKGKYLPNNNIDYKNIDIKKSLIKEKCKKYNVTITEYITGVIIYILNNTNERKSVICIPVDLRKYINKNAFNNFFSYIFIESSKKNFNEIIKDVKKQFKEKLNEEYLCKILKNNIFLKKIFNPVPYTLKKIVIEHGYWKAAHKATTVISNVGSININKNLKKYECYAEPDPTKLVKITISSCNEIITLNISSKIKDELIYQELKKIVY